MRVVFKGNNDRVLATVQADAVPELGEAVQLTIDNSTIKYIAISREFHFIIDDKPAQLVVVYLGSGEFHY